MYLFVSLRIVLRIIGIYVRIVGGGGGGGGGICENSRGGICENNRGGGDYEN